MLDVGRKLADESALREVRDRFKGEDPLALLLNLFLSLTYMDPAEPGAANNLGSLAIRLMQVCPPIAKPMQVVFERLCSEAPARNGPTFWPVLLRVRATAEA
jgi:hypothetical protein